MDGRADLTYSRSTIRGEVNETAGANWGMLKQLSISQWCCHW